MMRALKRLNVVMAATAVLFLLITQTPLLALTQSLSDGAVVSEVHGLVVKELPIAKGDKVLGELQKIAVGDRLPEGTQVTTGSKSWTEVKWPDIVARAWSNSRFSIAPGRRLVYVGSGEVLIRLNKNRRNVEPYVVVTKYLQARVHGTTILVQSADKGSRVTVLEGFIKVLNRIDRNLMSVSPGVIYEAKSLAGQPLPPPADGLSLRFLGQGPPSGTPVAFTPIATPFINPVHVFVSNGEITNLYAAYPKQLVDHPLVMQFHEPLDSAPLIQRTMTSLPVQAPPNIQTDFPASLLKSAVKVEHAPEVVPYTIGHDVDELLPHKADTYEEHPPSKELSSEEEPVGSAVTPFAEGGTDAGGSDTSDSGEHKTQLNEPDGSPSKSDAEPPPPTTRNAPTESRAQTVDSTAEHTQPSEEAQPIEQPQPAEKSQPIEQPQPSEKSQPIEQPQPAEQPSPAEPMVPTEPPEPAEAPSSPPQMKDSE